MRNKTIHNLVDNPVTPGVLLISCAVIAMLLSNSFLAANYFSIINATAPINVLFIINDVLMTIFFIDIGLEIKYQVIKGNLSQPRQIFLPAIAALGGVIMPAIIFTFFNLHDPLALRGWAIPVATDIAFSLGVITLLGNRVPLALKIFLMAVAVIDDLIAIIIIGLFYTQHLSMLFLLFALLTIFVLYKMNTAGVKKVSPYLITGAILWFFMLNSGVHPTLSGVITALAIPVKKHDFIHKRLSLWITFLILPLFALANAGVSLKGINLAQITQPVPLGIALGLIFGKQIGIFSFTWLSVKAKVAPLPKAISWNLLYGMAILCGIGFTMSIFIGNLSYQGYSTNYLVVNKLGVLIGSSISAVAGYLVLRVITRK